MGFRTQIEGRNPLASHRTTWLLQSCPTVYMFDTTSSYSSCTRILKYSSSLNITNPSFLSHNFSNGLIPNEIPKGRNQIRLECSGHRRAMRSDSISCLVVNEREIAYCREISSFAYVPNGDDGVHSVAIRSITDRYTEQQQFVQITYRNLQKTQH